MSKVTIRIYGILQGVRQKPGNNRGIEKRRIVGYHFYERECSLLSLGFPLRGDSRCRLHESNGQTVMEDRKNPE